MPTFQLQTYAHLKLKHNTTSGTININQLSESKSKSKENPSSVREKRNHNRCALLSHHRYGAIFFLVSLSRARTLQLFKRNRKKNTSPCNYIHSYSKKTLEKKASVLCTPVIKSNLLYYSFVLACKFHAKTEY